MANANDAGRARGAAAGSSPVFTFGIEEEYFLVDRTTRAPISADQDGLMEGFKAGLGRQVSDEFMCSQVEVSTSVCRTPNEARAELKRLRLAVDEVAAHRGLALIAASTHPFARWADQNIADRPRYHDIARDLAGVGRRLNTCGMHVHVGIENEDLRIHIMNQARHFLPLLLALSTSSPFWQGQDTGLKSYRLAVTDAQPRSGLPELFASWRDYQHAIDALSRSGAIEDATKIWWDLRPSVRFPTLEMRITDVCTRLEDAVTISSLFVCVCQMLYRLRRADLTWHSYPLLLLNENRWRAQRYGIGGNLIDYGKGSQVSCAALVRELVAMVEEDAVALDCVVEVNRAPKIAELGTSADRQLAYFDRLRKSGASDFEALNGVVDHLIEESRPAP